MQSDFSQFDLKPHSDSRVQGFPNYQNLSTNF